MGDLKIALQLQDCTIIDVIYFMLRNTKVFTKLQNVSILNDALIHDCTCFWSIIINEIIRNYMPETANTQTENVSCVHSIGCTQ